MSVELTPQQQQALDGARGQPVSLIDPRTKATYVLVPTQEYESVREVLEDEKVQRGVRRRALRNAIGHVLESDCEPV
jgi:hypothetical protein